MLIPRQPDNPEGHFREERGNFAIERLEAASALRQGKPSVLSVFNQRTEGLLAYGELSPEIIEVPKQGSTLLGAMAMAINAVTHAESAAVLFQQMTRANGEPLARVDSPRHIDTTTTAIMDFHLPIHGLFEIHEMAFPPSKLLGETDETEKIPRIVATLGESAIVAPFKFGVARHHGRAIWGAMTGYRESIPDAALSSDEAGEAQPQEDRQTQRQADFVVAIASPRLRGIQLVGREELLQKCVIKHAQVVRSVEPED